MRGAQQLLVFAALSDDWGLVLAPPYVGARISVTSQFCVLFLTFSHANFEFMENPLSISLVGIQFLQPSFNKGSTSPLAHHPAEVVEDKSY